ncbi:MAG TPA: hypothetical protein PK230_02705, partial [Chitinophagales bacterium]|nr:hypothetical protein [Chitinophagales bacterium]
TRTCTVTDDIDITVNDLPTVNLGSDFIGCNNNFAGVNATIDAGAGFSYSWSNSATTQTINPTTSNTYTVTITDGNGCKSSDAVVITINQPPNVTPADLTITNVTNCALANGALAFPSPGGVTVETGSGFVSTGDDITGTSPLTNLGVGTYTLVYTTNATGCYTEVTVSVGSATALPPTPTISPNNPSICVNGIIPTFTASPNGGGGPSWQWYGPNNNATIISGATNATYTPTAAQVDVSTPGSYDFYVTNTVLGCESLPATVTLTIQAPPTPSIVAVPSSTICSGNSITLDADNIAGATYSWSNSGGSNSSATFAPTNLTASPTTVTYTVTVTEGVCTVPTNIAITVNPNPTAGLLTPTQSLCSLNNGQIAFTNPSGGNVYYSSGTSYNTVTGTDVTGTSPVTALAAGDYTFRFENPTTSCFTDVSTTITNNNTITAPSVAPISAVCYTGLATTNPSISASGSPGTYQWYGPNNPATLIIGETVAAYTPVVVGSATSATTYTFYVASVVGSCESTKTPITFTINPLPSPTINGNDVLCNGTASNTLTVTPAFSSYLWSDGNNGASISNATTNNTNYAVTVTDGNGCQSATNVTVVVNNAVTTTITPATIGICNGSSVAFDAGSGFDSYIWSNSGGSSQTASYSNITTNTTYTVIVTATQNGVTCSGTANASVTVNPNPNLTATSSQTINVCNGSTANLSSVTYTNSGANGTQFYTDSNGDPVLSASNTIVPTTPGQYIYVLTETVGATGCSDTLQIRVNVNAAPSITLTPNSTSICIGSSFDLSTLTVNDANSTTGTISYHSGTPATVANQLASASVSPTTNTTYYIKKTVGTCSDEEPFAITVNPLPTASIGGSTAICSGNSTTLTASGGTTYLWNNNSTNAALAVSPTSNTTYTVTVTNANNCSSITSASVTVNTVLSLSNQQTNCNIAGTQYTVSFDINGTGPFSVTGVAGTLTGNSFVSNAIPIASTPTISISSTATGACPAISYTPTPACTTPSSCTTTTGCFGANLVVDGSFETFNAGTPFTNFTSNYDYSPCPGTICTNSSTGQPILCQYDFSVQTSPNPCNSDFSSNLNDHTSGSGNMMIVDFPAGNVGTNNRIWCQTVSLAANTNYCFGAYFINILPTGTGLPTPLLGLSANGTLLGTVGVPETEQWTSGSYQFNSGAGGSYTICITNENFGAIGYDVAIDDIYIRPTTTGTPPNATDDIASICQGQASQVINVLSNDTAGSNPIASINIITPPPFTDGEISAVNFA